VRDGIFSDRCGQILIGDGDSPVRRSISHLLRSASYATRSYADGHQLLEGARQERPALVIVDTALPGLSGYEVCLRLRKEFGQLLPIIFISAERAEAHDRIAALELGADDLVPKPIHEGELLARVHRLLERTPAVASGAQSLTRREGEVLALLALGLTQRDIANELVVSPKTVGSHIQNLLGKLGVHSRTQAVALAFRDGLLDGQNASRGDGAPRAISRRRIEF
jgi:DNA-binding NarL/FixJ family response regulator